MYHTTRIILRLRTHVFNEVRLRGSNVKVAVPERAPVVRSRIQPHDV